MKFKFLSLFSAAAMLAGMTACHDADPKVPTAEAEEFNSITAMFFNDERDENAFPGEIDYDNHIITIVVPYTYPAESDSYLEMADLTRMSIRGNFPSGYILEPPLLEIDLTKDNYYTMTDRFGKKTQWIIRGEIRKSNKCEFLDFMLPDAGVPGVIRTDIGRVSLVTAEEELGVQYADYEISFGATVSPDPRTEIVDWDNEPVITVTAQDGVSKTEYRFIKEEPKKLPFGLREGSAKIAWAVKQSDLGVEMLTQPEIDAGDKRFNGSAGLGIADNYLVLNEAGHNKAYVINLKNGKFVTTIDLSALGVASTGLGKNHRMCSDQNGNLLFAVSRLANEGNMELWRMKGINGQLEKIVSYNDYSAMCNTLSVTGDLYGNAVITTNANGGITGFRWTVKGGKVVSEAPDKFVPKGYTGNCWGTMDFVHTSADPNSEYFAIGYCGLSPVPPTASGADNRTCTWHKADNSIKSYGSFCITSNSVENAGDYIEFNRSRYFIHNVQNTLGYGYGSSLVMYDVSAGDMNTQAIKFDGSAGGVNLKSNYSAPNAAGTKDKAGNGGDVMFYGDPDGYYLYIFFEFPNGYVGCVRADCIDMN